ncbi:helical backbone metal receptor [Azoarcus sp. KH32C]|uniref:helical backbone metal receptor n=1 Tax=Azoarcus sp. KH32C TaxID=748247 RepID=UPI0002386F89|nr:helical backbone metal receptor [Azoarcus sp. KH32C]BAL22851.1 iron hydroxamate ABC transporter periplasmic protein [Azoarcus sp. KH32C]
MDCSTLPEAPAALTDAAGKLHRPAEGEVRIVSLVPSLTELLCELGLTDRLVGRTGFCIHPRETLKPIRKVGGTKDVKLDVVRELAPTHLIVNIDENRRETVEELAAFVPNIIVTHPCRPEDNFELFRLFGHVFGCEEEASRLAAELEASLAAAAAVARALPPERVLYLIWREPWMSVSRDTYISATLRALGWETLPADAALRYPEIDWSAPWMSEAARVFLSSEPYCFRERHLDEVAALSGRPVALIDGEMTSWYGSRAAAGLRYLAELRMRLARS